MSRRFGWVIITENLQHREQELLKDFRGNKIPMLRSKKSASTHIMWKVDDDLELCLGFGKNFTLIQGQFDLGLALPDGVEALCRKYSGTGTALLVSVEGTSDSYSLKKFKNSDLVQSYGSCEGNEIAKECIGPQPEKNEDDQVDEWALVKEVEKEGVLYDEMCKLEFEVYNYSQPSPACSKEERKWWQFWK